MAGIGGASRFGEPSIQLPMEFFKKAGGGAAQRAFLSSRGRSSLQKKDAEQGTGRKPQKTKDPVQQGIVGYPEDGAMGTDFLKRSDLMGGFERSKGRMDIKEDK